MTPQPLYVARDQSPAYALRYSWSGWATNGNLNELAEDSWLALTASWETDGLRLLERQVQRRDIHLTFSTTPDVSPIICISLSEGISSNPLRKSPWHFRIIWPTC